MTRQPSRRERLPSTSKAKTYPILIVVTSTGISNHTTISYIHKLTSDSYRVGFVALVSLSLYEACLVDSMVLVLMVSSMPLYPTILSAPLLQDSADSAYCLAVGLCI